MSIRGSAPAILQSRRARCVCATCNNGWMSEIVEAAKPALLPLIEGKRCRLSSDDKSRITAWIAVAVTVSEFEDREHITVPRHHRDWLWTTRTAPPDWKIWLGDYARDKWIPQWIHHRFSVTEPGEPPPARRQEAPMNAQTTTYAVGRLYIHALSSAVPGGALDWQFQGRDHDLLRQLWPTAPYSLLWPPPTMNDKDADRIAGALMEFSLRILGLPRRASWCRSCRSTPLSLQPLQHHSPTAANIPSARHTDGTVPTSPPAPARNLPHRTAAGRRPSRPPPPRAPAGRTSPPAPPRFRRARCRRAWSPPGPSRPPSP